MANWTIKPKGKKKNKTWRLLDPQGTPVTSWQSGTPC